MPNDNIAVIRYIVTSSHRINDLRFYGLTV